MRDAYSELEGESGNPKRRKIDSVHPTSTADVLAGEDDSLDGCNTTMTTAPTEVLSAMSATNDAVTSSTSTNTSTASSIQPDVQSITVPASVSTSISPLTVSPPPASSLTVTELTGSTSPGTTVDCATVPVRLPVLYETPVSALPPSVPLSSSSRKGTFVDKSKYKSLQKTNQRLKRTISKLKQDVRELKSVSIVWRLLIVGAVISGQCVNLT